MNGHFTKKFMIAAIAWAAGLSAGAAQAQLPKTVVLTNDDQSIGNTVSAYNIVLHRSPCDPGPCLVPVPGSPFSTQGGIGTNGGDIATPRIVTVGISHFCTFASNAGDSSISSFQAEYKSKLSLVGNFTLTGHTGNSGDVALFMANAETPLLAAYSQSKILVAWSLKRGCILRYPFVVGTHVEGLNGGAISSMAYTTNGQYLIVAYGDGSIGSYSVRTGFTLVSQELTTGFACGGVATSLAIPNDGYVIFGDTTSSTAEIETAYVNPDGTLNPTQDFGGSCHPGELGAGLGSSTISANSNSTLLYVANTNSGSMDTEDYADGIVSWGGCPLTTLRGFGTQWTTPGQIAFTYRKGEFHQGNALFVAEAGGGLSPGSFIGYLKAAPKTGCITEEPASPVSDPASPNLQSIALQSITPRD